MLALTIDAGQMPTSDPCTVCCCQTVSLKPGETLPLRLDYAPWAVPFARRGLACEPVVTIEEKLTCPPSSGSNLPPQNDPTNVYTGPVDAPVTGNLSTQVTDPESDPLTFKVHPMYGPQHGKLVLQPDGSFEYTPAPGFTGSDRAFVSVSDGVNAPILVEALFAIGASVPDPIATPDLSVGPAIVDQRLYTVTIPIKASPAAKPCQVFRLTMRQGALDCDCNCYYHVDCVDVRIAQC